jgi:hypothetical protein
MNGLTDLLLVGAIVLAAVWYAARTLGPRAWRARRGAAAAGACGGCNSCGSATAATGGGVAAAGGVAATGAAETCVPVAAIGHRQSQRTATRHHPEES